MIKQPGWADSLPTSMKTFLGLQCPLEHIFKAFYSSWGLHLSRSCRSTPFLSLEPWAVSCERYYGNSTVNKYLHSLTDKMCGWWPIRDTYLQAGPLQDEYVLVENDALFYPDPVSALWAWSWFLPSNFAKPVNFSTFNQSRLPNSPISN